MKNPSITCGHCMFFKNRRLHSQPCVEGGILEFAKPCASFEPDVVSTRVPLGKSNPVISLIQSINALSDFSAVIMAELLISRTRLRKYTELSLFQPVYFRWYGNGKYLSHWAKAYVLDAGPEDVQLINRGGTFTITVPNPSDSVLTISEFKPLFEKLVAQGRSHDPRQASHQNRIGEVSTLDAAVKRGGAKHEARRSSVGRAVSVAKADEYAETKRRRKRQDVLETEDEGNGVSSVRIR